MRKVTFFLTLIGALSLSAAPYNGRVFVDSNENGRWDKGEKLLRGVKVSDGLNVTETAADGTYSCLTSEGAIHLHHHPLRI